MEPQVVVGAAVVRDGRLLAARRTSPPSTAGRWELPGGKVDPGETDDEALVREVQEELGVVVRVEQWLPGEQPLPGGYLLRVAVVALITGDPVPHEHDRVRWLSASELQDVDWLEGDRPFVEAVSARLSPGSPRLEP